MGSPPSRTETSQPPTGALVLVPTAQVVPRERGRRAARLRPLAHLSPFPQAAWARWALRAAFALPYLAVAVWGSRMPLPSSPIDRVIANVGKLDWSGSSLKLIGELYPPLADLVTALLTITFPGGELALGIVGALAAGFFVQEMLQFLVRRRMPGTVIAVLILAVAANPITFYLATQFSSLFVASALFGIGLLDMLRFARWDATRSGFRAGLLFMSAALTSRVGIALVLAAAATAPVLVPRRSAARMRVAVVVVLLFPTVAAFVTWVLLELAFRARDPGQLFAALGTNAPTHATAWQLITSNGGIPIAASLLAACVVALILRRPIAIAVAAIVYASHIIAMLLGLASGDSAGATFLTMTAFSFALIPTVRSRGATVGIGLVAAVQIGIGWWLAFSTPAVVEWMRALLPA